ncbi:MAG: MMPL family transporter [Treponema sp.]|jgi:predicted RND superfamily exporter protein|nr:MMPL family transporter [Treponema sp.]
MNFLRNWSNIYRRPWLIVGILAVITAFFALQLPKLQLDNNNLRFVPSNDEALEQSRYIDDTFGSSLFILVGLERKFGDVFDREFLQRIKEYTDRIGMIDIVGSVNSIMTTDYISSQDDMIVVEKLVGDDFAGTPAEIAELKRRLSSWDMYKRSLVSDDFTATQIYVPLDIDSERSGDPEVVNSFVEIRDRAYEMFDGTAEVYVTGLPVISATINEATHADLTTLVPLVVLVTLAVLFVPLRRIGFVALAVLSVCIAVIWSMGAMPLFGVRLSVISTVLPVVLIAVGSSYALHLVIHYVKEADGVEGMTRGEHTEFVIRLVKKLGKAVFLAALTTFVSFTAFCWTNVLPIREFGVFSAFGVASSFLIAVLLTPALLVIRGPKALHKLRIKSAADADVMVRTSHRMAAFFTKITSHYKIVLFFTLVIVIVSLVGASRLVIDNIFVEYFRADTDIVKSDVFIREKFGGSKVISVVVEADSPEILLHPDSLSALDGLNGYLEERVPSVGKVLSFTSLIKRINQVFNADESPQGLKIGTGSVEQEMDGFGFGFDEGGGDDFWFDEGMADFVETGEADENSAQAEAFIQSEASTPLTAMEIARLLDRAEIAGTDFVLEFKKQVNYEGAAYYEIPTSLEKYGKTSAQELQALVSNYLILLSGNISAYANDSLEPTAIKSTLQLRTLGQKDTDGVVNLINQYVSENFPDDVRVIVGGSALVEASTNTNVVRSVWTSILIALVSAFIIITVSNRSFIAGLIVISTLGVLILINFAVMGFVGIKLNIGTALIASLTIGIGIDYTIHYIEALKRERRNGGDFLLRTYLSPAVAILTDAISVSAGFAVLLFSRFTMLADFGFLVALSMLLSAAAGLILTPALLLCIKPKFAELQASQA